MLLKNNDDQQRPLGDAMSIRTVLQIGIAIMWVVLFAPKPQAKAFQLF